MCNVHLYLSLCVCIQVWVLNIFSGLLWLEISVKQWVLLKANTINPFIVASNPITLQEKQWIECLFSIFIFPLLHSDQIDLKRGKIWKFYGFATPDVPFAVINSMTIRHVWSMVEPRYSDSLGDTLWYTISSFSTIYLPVYKTKPVFIC